MGSIGKQRRDLDKYLPLLNRMSYEGFIRSCPARKRKVYVEAVKSLSTEPVNRRDAKIRAFLKAEKLNLSLKHDPAPRVIQPRSPRYNVEVGRYLRPVEGILYRSLAKLFGDKSKPVVYKGMNADECGAALKEAWDGFLNPVAYGLDASRFDQHVSVAALIQEHLVYLKCFSTPERKELRRLLSWQLVNEGVARAHDGDLRYCVEGCRMSGDMNTSMGNCLLMCLMVRSYMEHSAIIDYRLVNNGDDCVVILESQQSAQFESGLTEWFLEMGFTMKVEPPVHVLEQVEFCQGHPVCVGGSWRMVRNLVPGYSRDLTSLQHFRTAKDIRNWLHTEGVARRGLMAGVPIYQQLFRRMLELGRGGAIVRLENQGESNTVKYWAERMTHGYLPVEEHTRFSFYLAFGILPDMQKSLEAQLKQWEFPIAAPIDVVDASPATTQDFLFNFDKLASNG